MSYDLLVPHLRIPVECNWSQWHNVLASGTSSSSSSPSPSPHQIRSVLQTLQRLRSNLQHALEGESIDFIVSIPDALEACKEYAGALYECLERFEDDGMRRDAEDDHSNNMMCQWKDTSTKKIETNSSLAWELINTVWNLSVLQCYLAAQESLDTKPGAKSASTLLQASASVLASVQSYANSWSHESTVLMTQLQSYTPYLLAQAQRAAYQCVVSAARPPHVMCAKLAAATAQLYAQVGEANDQPKDVWICHNAYIWSLYFYALCEYHQAIVHQGKRERGLEVARLRKALDYVGQGQQMDDCADANERSMSAWPDLASLADMLAALHDQARHENDTAERRQRVLDIQQLPHVTPQITVRVDAHIQIIPPRTESLFHGSAIDDAETVARVPLSESPASPPAAHERRSTSSNGISSSDNYESFVEQRRNLQHEMQEVFAAVKHQADEKAENGRRALATVNLPHNLTAYRQECNGGGIPADLWTRVERLQQDEMLSHLQQQMWQLKDASHVAHDLYQSVRRQLSEDLQADQNFRQAHPHFDGHSVADVQRAFRQTLQHYAKLMESAEQGDALMLERVSMLDTDPKYKLLQFRKSQLDRLVPARGSVDVIANAKELSRLLVELSNLFERREQLLDDLQGTIDDIDASRVDKESGTDHALEEAREPFDKVLQKLRTNIAEQSDLIRIILKENETFMEERNANRTSTSSDRSIVMMEDALRHVDQLAEDLREGLGFYRGVTPKLARIQQQAGDASARLVVERVEYEDRQRRKNQEDQDARMAASLAAGGGTSQSTTSTDVYQPRVMGDRGGQSQPLAVGMGVGITIPHDADSLRQRPPPPPGDDASSMDNDDERPRTLRSYYSERPGPMSPGPSRSSSSSSQQQQQQQQPGVESVSHDGPVVRVDDEKVASLVAMEFDAGAVVAALRKYDNNFEQALDELLSE